MENSLFKRLLLVFAILITSSSAFAKKLKMKEVNNMLAAASINEGKQIALICIACHSLKKDGPNKIGPNLFGIVGAKKGRKKNYDYSPAFKKMKQGTWTVDELSEWLKDPEEFVPGNKMSFLGILDPQDRMDVIAYLMTLK